VDAARAESKADLWEHLFDRPLVFLTPEIALAEPAPSATEETHHSAPTPGSDQETEQDQADLLPSQELTSPGLFANDGMSEAGRKVLYFHFLRMLNNQAGTREGQDIEALHDMRVATRRMRSALRIFSPYFKRDAIRPHVLGLRRTARTLGEVRDLDVFMEKARKYLKTLPPEGADDLAPLLQVWHKQREKARTKMIAYLDDEKYQRFVRDFHRFLTTPGAGARKMKGFPPKPFQVRHVAPRLIYTRWEHVQAFEPVLKDAPISVLHALRIECKRLRYTLEFFAEILGPEAKQVIEQVVRLQDHLGDLHDADVANTMLSDFLFSGQEAPGGPKIAPGVVAYLASKQRDLQRLIDTFPQAWQAFNQPEVRRWLASAIAAL
jgi:CHAD domain-containing protein